MCQQDSISHQANISRFCFLTTQARLVERCHGNLWFGLLHFGVSPAQTGACFGPERFLLVIYQIKVSLLES